MMIMLIVNNNINNNNSNDNQFISKLNYQIHSCALLYIIMNAKVADSVSLRKLYFSSCRALFISRDGSLGCSFEFAEDKTGSNPTENILHVLFFDSVTIFLSF